MKTLTRLLCGVLFLPLTVSADPLLISASGRSTSKAGAIAAAERQIVLDMQSAGFLRSEGYQIGDMRLIDVSRSGKVYVARVDAELMQGAEPERVAFVIAGDKNQKPYLQSLVEQARTVVNSRHRDKQMPLEIVDVLLEDALRINTLADLQRPELDEDLDPLAQAQHASRVYVLIPSKDDSLVFLVATHSKTGNGKTIRTLRRNTATKATTLATQIAESVLLDSGGTSIATRSRSVLTLASPGAGIRKGQEVVLSADTVDGVDGREAVIVTRGVVTATSRAKVQVLTNRPVSASVARKLRLTPLPKHGVVIHESDW